MKVICLGVGDASDEKYGNNSHLVVSGNTNILLDCGTLVPSTWWKFGKPCNFLDAIYISHKHPDHCFGLLPMLIRMNQDGRKKQINIICQEGTADYLAGLAGGVETFSERFKFPIVFIVVAAGVAVEVGNLSLSFAPTFHLEEPNLAIRLHDGAHVLCYSGDGQILDATSELYRGADLLIQEGYFYDLQKPGHASVKDAMAAAEKMQVKRLALTHLNRLFRLHELPKYRDTIKSAMVAVSIPEPGQVYEL